IVPPNSHSKVAKISFSFAVKKTPASLGAASLMVHRAPNSAFVAITPAACPVVKHSPPPTTLHSKNLMISSMCLVSRVSPVFSSCKHSIVSSTPSIFATRRLTPLVEVKSTTSPAATGKPEPASASHSPVWAPMNFLQFSPDISDQRPLFVASLTHLNKTNHSGSAPDAHAAVITPTEKI